MYVHVCMCVLGRPDASDSLSHAILLQYIPDGLASSFPCTHQFVRKDLNLHTRIHAGVRTYMNQYKLTRIEIPNNGTIRIG